MAKRKATRKKAAKSATSKASREKSSRKNTKITRIKKAAPAKKKAKRTAAKAPQKETTRSKKGKKKTSKAQPVKKKAATKAAKSAVTAKKTTKKTAKKAAKTKATAKAAAKKTTKKAVTKGATKKPASKKTAKKRKKGTEPESVRKVKVVEPAEPGFPLKEIRARLGLIGPQIGELEWLEGLYLYGAKMLDMPRLERVDFIVVYRGLRNAARLKAAETELQTLLAAVLPLDFELKFTGTLEIGRLLQEGNPAAQALLGYAESVFTRGA